MGESRLAFQAGKSAKRNPKATARPVAPTKLAGFIVSGISIEAVITLENTTPRKRPTKLPKARGRRLSQLTEPPRKTCSRCHCRYLWVAVNTTPSLSTNYTEEA
jgi:hypothetical protein